MQIMKKLSLKIYLKPLILVIIKYAHLTNINILILKYPSEIGIYYFSFSARQYRCQVPVQ